MTTLARPMTAEDLLRMPNDGRRHELVKGELRSMPPAGYEHGGIGINIAAPLAMYVKATEIGQVFLAETGFILAKDPDTVRAPDVAFVSKAHMEEHKGKSGYWPGPPDLAVEVISPGDTYTEVDEKVSEWLESGCRMVVVVNPRKRTVAINQSRSEISILTEEDSLDGGEVVPGWSLPVREIFD